MDAQWYGGMGYLVWRHPSEGCWGVGGQAAVAGLLVAGVPAGWDLGCNLYDQV